MYDTVSSKERCKRTASVHEESIDLKKSNGKEGEKVKLATYNIWNSEEGMPARREAICREIVEIGADLICLQEVADDKTAETIAAKAGFDFLFFDSYENEQEGLCIVSKMPFEKTESWCHDMNAIFVRFHYQSREIGIVNLHLPWDSVRERERQIARIVTRINEQELDAAFLLGDFNCSETSDVHRYLKGDCLLSGEEANPRWYDLAEAYAEISETAAESTLNFRENPRFQNNTIETNERFDRIILRNTYPEEFPVLKQCILFGKTIYEDIKCSASDHYGVMADIEFGGELG